tara:strand:- start:1757 stop:2386 length:630 start_codon:yes stop_codon:yes gene_type:complete
MSYLLLDLFDIPVKKFKEYNTYYIDKQVIPIYSKYILYKIPYHSNSSYIRRNFLNKDDFYKLLNSKKDYKPVSSKEYNKGIYYIPHLPKGDIISYEIVPFKTPLYNIISKPYYIDQIIIFTKSPSELPFTSLLNIYTNCLSSKDNLNLSIEFIAYNITITPYFTTAIYFPKKYPIINLNDYYEIDLQNFHIDFNKIDKRNNIQIRCAFI